MHLIYVLLATQIVKIVRVKLSAKSVLMDIPCQQMLLRVCASPANLHVRLALAQQLLALLALVEKLKKDQSAKIKLIQSLN